jgi:hypothetical protein
MRHSSPSQLNVGSSSYMPHIYRPVVQNYPHTDTSGLNRSIVEQQHDSSYATPTTPEN